MTRDPLRYRLARAAGSRRNGRQVMALRLMQVGGMGLLDGAGLVKWDSSDKSGTIAAFLAHVREQATLDAERDWRMVVALVNRPQGALPQRAAGDGVADDGVVT